MLEILFSYLGWILFIGILLFIISLGIRIVRALEKGIIERLGKFKKVRASNLRL